MASSDQRDPEEIEATTEQVNDLFNSEEVGWVQLIPPHSEDDPVPFLNHHVVVQGYLGSLLFHIHTPIAIEAVGIYDDR